MIPQTARWLAVAAATFTASLTAAQEQPKLPLTVQITSPLGRTGISGPVRIVARVAFDPKTAIGPVKFYVDGKEVGQDNDGPPYAVEWNDANPFDLREIVVQVADAAGRTAKDSVTLEPLGVNDQVSVLSVLLEASVNDPSGRAINNLTRNDFVLTDDGAPQTIDSALVDPLPTTYALLVDSSQSMSRNLDFVRDAANEMPTHLRPKDQVLVAPFRKTLGAVTGPTKDRETIAGAIDAIDSSGGTAILDCLADAAKRLTEQATRHVIVLITDGYDENSTLSFNEALEAIKASDATVYIVAIGGIAGISLEGRELLTRIARETGGRAFFPVREFQLADLGGLIAADVQQKYLLTFTPTNQKIDGTWRTVTLTTTDPAQAVKVKAGYRAPAPPPVRPQLELTVRDLDRGFVDIGIDDLEVVEDGVAQKLDAFEEAIAPVSAVLVLDNSGSMKRDTDAVKAAARAFVAALPAKDSLAVIHFADKVTLTQDLSTKRDLSNAAIDDYAANGGTALYDALLTSLERLATVDGRRVVVVLTDGRDENNPGTAPGSTHVLPDVLDAIKTAGATIFTIGLGANVDRATLEAVSMMSGGESYFPENVSMLDAEYRRILENLRRRYVIKYTSTNPARDGAWRNVEIRAKRPGLVVESRGGYFAPTGVPTSGKGAGSH